MAVTKIPREDPHADSSSSEEESESGSEIESQSDKKPEPESESEAESESESESESASEEAPKTAGSTVKPNLKRKESEPSEIPKPKLASKTDDSSSDSESEKKKKLKSSSAVKKSTVTESPKTPKAETSIPETPKTTPKTVKKIFDNVEFRSSFRRVDDSLKSLRAPVATELVANLVEGSKLSMSRPKAKSLEVRFKKLEADELALKIRESELATYTYKLVYDFLKSQD